MSRRRAKLLPRSRGQTFAKQERLRQQEATAKATPTREAATSHIPAPENGIVYKVQISAGHREVGKFVLQHVAIVMHGTFDIGAPPRLDQVRDRTLRFVRRSP